jgi:hypothetical protein
VTFVVIGLFVFAAGAVVSADIGGMGTKWREVSMSFYDRRRTGPDAYERNTRLFRLYYRGLAIFSPLLIFGRLLSLA